MDSKRPSLKDSRWYVMMVHGDSPMVLSLEPKTYDECYRDVRWQRTGGTDAEMAICFYDPSVRMFKSSDTGKYYQPTISPYTQEYWYRFNKELEDTYHADETPSERDCAPTEPISLLGQLRQIYDRARERTR